MRYVWIVWERDGKGIDSAWLDERQATDRAVEILYPGMPTPTGKYGLVSPFLQQVKLSDKADSQSGDMSDTIGDDQKRIAELGHESAHFQREAKHLDKRIAELEKALEKEIANRDAEADKMRDIADALGMGEHYNEGCGDDHEHLDHHMLVDAITGAMIPRDRDGNDTRPWAIADRRIAELEADNKRLSEAWKQLTTKTETSGSPLQILRGRTVVSGYIEAQLPHPPERDYEDEWGEDDADSPSTSEGTA